MITDLLPYLVATGAAASGSTTIVLNVGAGGGYPVLPGDRVLVCGGGGTGVPTGVTDTKGHTYNLIQSNATSPASWQFEATATLGLRSDVPHTITVTYSGTGSAKQVVVFGVSGAMAGCIGAAGAVDTPANVTAAGTSAAPAVTSGALANVAPGELVVATLTSAQAGGAPTWGTGWLPLGTAQTGATSYSSTAVWTPLQPRIGNTTGTAAVTAAATIGSSQAWTMAITAIKPGAATQKALVGATVYHGAYPSTSGDVTAAFKFDQITGTHAGHNARKTYFNETMWPATINTPRPVGTYSDNGIWQYLCIKPTRAVGGGAGSEKTNLTTALILWKNYLAQQGPANGGFAVILWQECNLWGKTGSFGDGSSTPQGAGSTPYWSAGQPPVTEQVAASNYHDYAQYYTPTIYAAGIPVAYDPVVSSIKPGVDWFPGRKWCSAYVCDYYFHSDYASPTGVGKGNDMTAFIAQAQAATPMLPFGLAEVGVDDSANATQADIWYAGYRGWVRNVVVAPVLAYVAAGGYLAPSAWYASGQGTNDIDPAPPVSTPQTVIDQWQYFYNQLMTAAAGAPSITTTSPLPGATVGQPYTGVDLLASGGAPPYTWSITSGQLPAGLHLAAATGAITGTPTAPVTRTPTFQVTDSLGATATAVLSVTVTAAALRIPAQSFPAAVVGTTYAANAAATGGTPKYTWTLTSGALPSGLILNSDGGITGTPTIPGPATFTLTVTDQASATAAQQFTIGVTAAGTLTITSTTLPGAVAGKTYSAPLAATGGTPPYTWSITTGSLPPGLALNSLGTITGVPVATSLAAATYLFTIGVADSATHTASAAVSITVTVAAPAPPAKGPWRILYTVPQPDGTVLGEIVQARSKTVTLRTGVGQNHEVAADIDGRSLAASSVTELQTDLQVMFGPQVIFCGRIVPTQDQLDAASHRTTITALDYREVLRRRSLRATDPPAGSAGTNLAWTAVEQAQIAWELIASTQGRPGGNLGIARGAGKTTGTTQTVTFAAGDYVADDIDSLAQLTNGFEWDISAYGPADLRLDVWSPARGADSGLVLAWGDARISSITRSVDPSAYANSVYVTGNTGGGLTVYIADAANIATRPEGRWDITQGSSLRTQASLNSYGPAILAAAQVLVPSYQVTFYPGGWDGPGWMWLGDYVTLQISSGRLSENPKLRVMELSFNISADNVETLTATLGLIPRRWRKDLAWLRHLLWRQIARP